MEETRLRGCKTDIKIALPEDVKFIIKKLRESGHEAYAVGGCVRDSIIGRKPDDWDITTDALPCEIKSCFKRTVDTGIEHGTVTVILKDRDKGSLSGYEVTTYRIDGEYRDGRHPKEVTFTPSLSEDLKRRDFTVNAMAYNEDTGLVDEFGGIEDLTHRIIRCVGDPDDRFNEDALRILRAVRFAAQLGFSVEAGTKEAISRHSENLRNVSKERIQVELTKLICSDNPYRLSEIGETGMGRYICEGFEDIDLARFAELSVRLKLRACGNEKKYLRYALLLMGSEKKSSKAFLKSLKLDNDTVKKASILAEELEKPLEGDRYLIKKTVQRIGRELFYDLVELKQGFHADMPEFYRESCGSEDIERISALIKDIDIKNEPIFLKELAVTGSDLMACGVKPGPGIGLILNSMMEEVLKQPEHNDREYLLKNFCEEKEKQR